MTTETQAGTRQSPIVIGIAGGVAAGKSTLIRELCSKLEAVSLVFDDYDRWGQWPEDLADWLAKGADPSAVRVPRLAQDLQALLNGHTIRHPLTDDPVQPAMVILVEEPFGRLRPELGPLMDRLLYVDLPADLSVLRMIQRALGLDSLPEGGPEALTHEDLAARIAGASSWLSRYALFRDGYAKIRERILATADLVLDGMLPTEDLAERALRWVDSI